MKKALLNWRYYVLFALGMVAMAGVLSVPSDELNSVEWAWCLLVSKVVGFGAGLAAYALMVRWSDKNLVPELCQFVKDGEGEDEDDEDEAMACPV